MKLKFTEETNNLFKKVKDKITSIDIIHKDVYKHTKDVYSISNLELEYHSLLEAHKVKSLEFNHADCNSSNFDAICNELQAIDYRLKQIKQEMRDSQK